MIVKNEKIHVVDIVFISLIWYLIEKLLQAYPFEIYKHNIGHLILQIKFCFSCFNPSLIFQILGRLVPSNQYYNFLNITG